MKSPAASTASKIASVAPPATASGFIMASETSIYIAAGTLVQLSGAVAVPRRCRCPCTPVSAPGDLRKRDRRCHAPALPLCTGSSPRPCRALHPGVRPWCLCACCMRTSQKVLSVGRVRIVLAAGRVKRHLAELRQY